MKRVSTAMFKKFHPNERAVSVPASTPPPSDSRSPSSAGRGGRGRGRGRSSRPPILDNRRDVQPQGNASSSTAVQEVISAAAAQLPMTSTAAVRYDPNTVLFEVVANFEGYTTIKLIDLIASSNLSILHRDLLPKILKLYLSPSLKYLACYLDASATEAECTALLQLLNLRNLRNHEYQFHSAPRVIGQSLASILYNRRHGNELPSLSSASAPPSSTAATVIPASIPASQPPVVNSDDAAALTLATIASLEAALQRASADAITTQNTIRLMVQSMTEQQEVISRLTLAASRATDLVQQQSQLVTSSSSSLSDVSSLLVPSQAKGTGVTTPLPPSQAKNAPLSIEAASGNKDAKSPTPPPTQIPVESPMIQTISSDNANQTSDDRENESDPSHRRSLSVPLVASANNATPSTLFRSPASTSQSSSSRQLNFDSLNDREAILTSASKLMAEALAILPPFKASPQSGARTVQLKLTPQGNLARPSVELLPTSSSGPNTRLQSSGAKSKSKSSRK